MEHQRASILVDTLLVVVVSHSREKLHHLVDLVSCPDLGILLHVVGVHF